MAGVSIAGLARELGIGPDRVKREFIWWCRVHRKRAEDYFSRVGGRPQYRLPAEFVEYLRGAVSRERRVVIENGQPRVIGGAS